MKKKLLFCVYVIMFFVVLLIGCTGSGTTSLIGKWVAEEDHNEFEEIEFFKDGSGTINGWEKFTWTALDNGELKLFDNGIEAESFEYKINGSLLILDGEEKYKRKK